MKGTSVRKELKIIKNHISLLVVRIFFPDFIVRVEQQLDEMKYYLAPDSAPDSAPYSAPYSKI